VTWDGADDTKNPKNWSFKRRWGITALVSLVTFMTPMSSAIIAPASNAIGDEFGIHSSFLKQLNFSIILLACVIGPLVLAPLCEVYGRVIVLQLANMCIAYALLSAFQRAGVNNVQILLDLQLCVRFRA
jgi:MFS family permease